jgi:hypothetical protein
MNDLLYSKYPNMIGRSRHRVEDIVQCLKDLNGALHAFHYLHVEGKDGNGNEIKEQKVRNDLLRMAEAHFRDLMDFEHEQGAFFRYHVLTALGYTSIADFEDRRTHKKENT